MFARLPRRCATSLARSTRCSLSLTSPHVFGHTIYESSRARAFSATVASSWKRDRDGNPPHPRSRKDRQKRRLTEQELLATLPRVSVYEFETLVKSEKATIDHARGYLEHLKADLMPLPVEKRREAAAKTDAGRRVLLFLWSKYGADPVQFLHTDFETRIGRTLCWFLLAQDLEEYLWKWIDQEVAKPGSPALSDFQSERRRLSWVGPLSADLLTAHAEWSPEHDLNPSFLCYKRTIDILSVYGDAADDVLMLPTLALERLCKKPFVCDTALYDILVRLVTGNTEARRAEPHRLYSRATAMLRHPSHPDPTFFMRWISETANFKHLRWAPDAKRNLTAAYMLRSAYILRHQNQPETAALLEGLIQEFSNDIWRHRCKELHTLDADFRLANIRRAGTVIPWCDEQSSKE